MFDEVERVGPPAGDKRKSRKREEKHEKENDGI